MPRISFDVNENLNKEFEKAIDKEAQSKSKVLRDLIEMYSKVRENSENKHSKVISKMKDIE